MICIRAPLRVSFGGGGCDLPAYYERFGGIVVSAAITRYCYAQVAETADGVGRVISADYGQRFRWEPARIPRTASPLALPKAALRTYAEQGALTSGVRLALAADVPPGSGLGSSSAMAVATLQALATRFASPLSREEAASQACALEIERLGMPIGKQDQYASAYGGLNMIEFTRERVHVTPLRLSPATREALDERLLLFWTRRSHDSARILRAQRADTQSRPEVIASLHEIKSIAVAMRYALEAGHLDGFGRLLDDAWQTKRRLSNAISSAAIDEWYAAARRAGALGGKITGAGGGGFLLLYVPPAQRHAVCEAMARCGLPEEPFRFDDQGMTRLSRAPKGWGQRFAFNDNTSAAPAPISCSA